MAFSYKGSLAFGLVYIPVTLHNCIKSNDIGFNMLDKKTMSRVKYIKTCELCDGRVVGQDDIIKGYEYEKGKYVTLSDSELDKIKTKADKTINVELFVDLAEIDLIYFDKAYYVQPTGGEKAFALLLAAMQSEGKCAVAKAVLAGKQSLIVFRAEKGVMLANTLHFADELQKNQFKPVAEKVSNQELNMAKAIIKSMSAPFQIENYKDDYKIRVKQAIADKIEGKQIQSPIEKFAPNITDLMDALTQTLQNSQAQKSPQRKTQAKATSKGGGKDSAKSKSEKSNNKDSAKSKSEKFNNKDSTKSKSGKANNKDSAKSKGEEALADKKRTRSRRNYNGNGDSANERFIR